MAYTAWSVVFGEQPTAAKWNQLGTNDAGFKDGTNIDDSVIGSRQLATGVPVQEVATAYSAVATGTTVIPQDDTIPQSTEGDQYMSQIITPKSATNILIVDVEIMFGNNANVGKIVALFQDAIANAVAAKFTYQGNWTDPTMLTLRHVMVAGTTSAITFKVRAGGSAAGTTTFNGSNSGRLLGASNKSSIKVTEVKA